MPFKAESKLRCMEMTEMPFIAHDKRGAVGEWGCTLSDFTGL